MLSGSITSRYTRGLYETAAHHGAVEVVDNGLQAVATALTIHPDFKLFMEHPLISEQTKTDAVSQVFGGQVDPVVVRFLKVLLSHDRSAYIQAVALRFRELAQAEEGFVRVEVETAQTFTESQMTHIQSQLSAVLGKKAEMSVTVNSNLIAGYRARVKNRVLDATVEGALNQFRNQLTVTGETKGSGR